MFNNHAGLNQALQYAKTVPGGKDLISIIRQAAAANSSHSNNNTQVNLSGLSNFQPGMHLFESITQSVMSDTAYKNQAAG